MNLKTNKLTAGLLAVILLLSVIPFSVPVSAAENEPVLTIGTPADLQALADAVNSGESYEGKTVTLTANIDLGGESNPWTAIGTAANPFKGTFDGGYHVISGLYIASGSAVGLFGEVNGGTVQNLVVRGEVNSTSNAAGVIGKLTAGHVRNCGNEASVSGGSCVGGIRHDRLHRRRDGTALESGQGGELLQRRHRDGTRHGRRRDRRTQGVVPGAGALL